MEQTTDNNAANTDTNNKEGDNNADSRQLIIFSAPFDCQMSQTSD